jgi:hypothetical protein
VAGGTAGQLTVYRDDPDDRGGAVKTVRETVGGVAYDGTSKMVDDWEAPDGTHLYRAYVDGTAAGSVTVQVDLDRCHLISLTDPATSVHGVKVDARSRWRTLERRGAVLDLIGKRRSVGVVDVTMGGRSGEAEFLCEGAAEQQALYDLLEQGVVCFRADRRTLYPGGYWLLRRVEFRATNPDHTQARAVVPWSLTWPAGTRDTLP